MSARQQCSERVYGGSFSGHACSKPPKVQDADGKWWCAIHSPNAKAARRAKQEAKYDARAAARQADAAEARRRFKVVDLDHPDRVVYLQPTFDGRAYYVVTEEVPRG